ncbi:MAG: winged helix-turn-helix domain-containing tetratricopeptide repeat protein [Pseudomonadales bacterium]
MGHFIRPDTRRIRKVGAEKRISVGSAIVDFSSLTIDGPAGHTSIEPKIMNLLQVLVDNAGSVVTRAELLEQVWGETYGGDESLSRGISLLRRAFGDTRGDQQYIETVPKRGYRLRAEISVASDEQAESALTTSRQTTIREGKSQGIKVRRPLYAIAALAILCLLGFVLYQGISSSESADSTHPISQNLERNTEDMQLRHKSIAVLPFEDLSSENDQQYLADGMAEEILNALVKFPDLRVIGRTSSFAYRKQNPNLDDIRATLNVAHVLSGSLRKQSDKIRITVTLTETEAGQTVWADSYDGELEDLFDLQTNIAREIARSLGGVLDLSTEQKLASKLTDNEQAYVLFVQGRSMARKFGYANKFKAKQLLAKAVEFDPEFAAAWAWLAQAELYLTLSAEAAEVPAHIASAQRATEQSIRLDPDLAMGRYVHSMLHEYNLDFATSIDAMEKAFALNPARPFFAVRRGVSYVVLGLPEKGATLIERGMSLDPTDAIGLYNLGVAQQSMGKLNEAKELIARSIDLGFEPAVVKLCTIMAQENEHDAALNCWRDLSNPIKARFGPLLSTPENWAVLTDAITSNDLSLRQKASTLVDQHYAQADIRPSVYPLFFYLYLGEFEKLMSTFVDRPFAFNAGAISGIWTDEEANRGLRQHPDFPKFAERIGLVRAWQQYGWPGQCEKIVGTDWSEGRFSCQ